MHHPLHRSAGYTRSMPRPVLARGAVLAALLLALVAPDAKAALSRWSSSNNRIYVYDGGSMTLTDIRAATPSLPDDALQRVNGGSVWLLNANIVVEEGTVLSLKGDVTELRLKSNPSAAPDTDVTSFVSIMAGNFNTSAGTGSAGTILIEGIKVTSWDTAANAPDTNSADGRAFIRARSALVNAVPQESRLDVLDSEVQYLGYEASERYGLSWKVNGDLALVNVLGDIKNSKIHHNHYGVYSFGLQGGQWLDNEVYENDGYGFDAHDHSDDLVIDGNNVHDNGKRDQKGRHGIILSESCLNARITNNVSNNNGGIDATTGSPEGNGIMLHDFADDALVEGNTTAGNADSGIAVFCSNRARVKNNTVSDNGKYGIRLTVAASDNTIEANQISGSGEYGIFMQPATDSNGICGDDLRPTGNIFTGNTIGTSGTAGVKITDATGNTFTGNTLNDGVSIRNANGTDEQTVAFSGNTFGEGAVVRLDGAADRPLRADFTDSPRVSLEIDTGSRARFTDDGGAIFDLTRDVMVAVNGSASQLDVTADNAGAPKVEVLTRPLFVTTDGTLVEVAPTLWETGGAHGKAWIARAANPVGTVQYRVGELQPRVSYEARRGDTVIGTFAASAGGEITFSDVPGDTATLTYTIVRSADQPQGGGDGGGGGGGAPGALLLALLGAAGLGRRVGRQVSWWWRRTASA